MLKKTNHNRSIIKVIFFMVLIGFLFCLQSFADTSHTGMRDITSHEIVALMGAGINLGNTLDATTSDEAEETGEE